VEGFRYATGEIIGVMDGDLSHPPELIPKLVLPILNGESEFSMASRYLKNKEIEKWPFIRKVISRGATILARPLTNISDPMSGFFFFKNNILDGVTLSPIGYKIMLEIVVKGNFQNIKEIPFIFKDRYKGESKLNWKEHVNYLGHLAKLYGYVLKNKFYK
jgi:dolichol-phosphate mannosyltransferase